MDSGEAESVTRDGGMLIDLVLDDCAGDVSGLPVRRREAVRAVVVRDGKLLMVSNNRGDCKLPGGGVEPGESHEDALVREVREETGYRLRAARSGSGADRPIVSLGRVIQRNPDSFEPGAIFEMTSHYYACTLDSCSARGATELDAYEAEMEFAAVWLTVAEALELNRAVLARSAGGAGGLASLGPVNDWIFREIRVLELIGSRAIF